MLATVLLIALTVPATVTSVYDGDTVKVQAEHWPGHTWTGSVRVLGIDTPEIRGKCPEEKIAAIAAREYVKAILGIHIMLHNIRLGKFAGRVLADVKFPGGIVVGQGRVTLDLAEQLIANGHARPYNGGARLGWCEE